MSDETSDPIWLPHIGRVSGAEMVERRYLPTRLFGTIESLMLRGQIPTARILEPDDLPRHPYLTDHFVAADTVLDVMKQRLGHTSEIRICFVEAAERSVVSAVRLPNKTYCILFGTAALSELGLRAAMVASFEPAIEYFNLERPLFVIPRHGFGGTAAFEEIQAAVASTPVVGSRPFLWGAFLAILLHELSHIVSGHLEFKLLYTHNIRSLSSENRALLFRTLEFDADAFAAKEALDYVRMGKSVPIFLRNMYRTPEHLVTFSMLCLVATNQLEDMSLALPAGNVERTANHFPFRWRLFDAWMTMAEVRALEYSGNREAAQTKLKHGYKLSLEFLWASSPDHLHAPDYQASMNEEGALRISILEEILGVWAAIRPLLSPLRRATGNLAPAQRDPDSRFAFSPIRKSLVPE